MGPASLLANLPSTVSVEGPMRQRKSIVMAVSRVQRLHGPAPRWIGALLLVGLLAAAGPGKAVTLNPGDILIANQGDSTVIRVNPADASQTPVTSGPPLLHSQGIAVAANGDLFVVNTSFSRAVGVIRVNPAIANQPPGHNQTVVTEGDNLFSPHGIAIAANGDLLIADSGAGPIR